MTGPVLLCLICIASLSLHLLCEFLWGRRKAQSRVESAGSSAGLCGPGGRPVEVEARLAVRDALAARDANERLLKEEL